ncbi:MAG: hypothetical protein N2317_02845 [Syntrophales bacterium]|nr:hypothetical protein [Syntrophales bacterium]
MILTNRKVQIVTTLISLIFFLSWPLTRAAHPQPAQVKISIFNFVATNIEAAGYGTTVSNMLTNSLSSEATFNILEKKELESFLALNDLQQNDDLQNVLNIGSRLGLDIIITGSVEKRGTIIDIRASVIDIAKRRPIYRRKINVLGDAALLSEVRKLSDDIKKAVAHNLRVQHEEEKEGLKGPEGITVRPGSKRVFLKWNPLPIQVSGYEVFRASKEAGPFAKVGQVVKPEFTDENVERNKTYYYKIRPISIQGVTGEYSNIVTAETAPSPNPPVILLTESHVKSITITWSPNPMPSDDPLQLKGYKIYRSKVEEGPYQEIGNIMGRDVGLGLDTALDKLLRVSYTDRNLADGEDYYYKITAYNEKGIESDFSKALKGTTIPPVEGLSAKGDMIREIEVTWNNLNYPYIKGYYVYRSTSPDSGFIKIKRLDAPSTDVKKIVYMDKEGLADATRYYYRVTAFETPDTETTPSITVSAITKGKPPVPTGFTAVSGLVKKVELSWTPLTDPDVEGYILFRSRDRSGKFLEVKRIRGREVSSYTDEEEGSSKLEDGVTYHYVLKSFNKVAVESDISNVVSATTKPKPVKPKGLKAESGKVRMIPLHWEPNPEKDIAVYHIYRTEEKIGNHFNLIAKVKNKTSYVDQELKDGRTYRYRILAEDKDELKSEYSEEVVATTKPRPEPPKPISGTIKNGFIEVRWQHGKEKDIVGYNIYEKGFLRVELLAQGLKDTIYKDERPLKKGKERTYVVTAVDADGLESDLSEDIVVKRD